MHTNLMAAPLYLPIASSISSVRPLHISVLCTHTPHSSHPMASLPTSLQQVPQSCLPVDERRALAPRLLLLWAPAARRPPRGIFSNKSNYFLVQLWSFLFFLSFCPFYFFFLLLPFPSQYVFTWAAANMHRYSIHPATIQHAINPWHTGGRQRQTKVSTYTCGRTRDRRD